MPTWVLTTQQKPIFLKKTYFEESSLSHPLYRKNMCTPATYSTVVDGLGNSRKYLMATSCTIKSQRVQAAEYKEAIGIGD